MTLLSGISLTEEKRTELLERCYDQNNRLRHLLEDVSLITRLEDGSSSIEREPVVVNELLDEIKEEFTCIPDEDRMLYHIRKVAQFILHWLKTTISSARSSSKMTASVWMKRTLRGFSRDSTEWIKAVLAARAVQVWDWR